MIDSRPVRSVVIAQSYHGTGNCVRRTRVHVFEREPSREHVTRSIDGWDAGIDATLHTAPSTLGVGEDGVGLYCATLPQ